MEKEKYYTPTIEEFHLGFEYEYLGSIKNDTWEKILTEQEDLSIMFDDFEHEMDGKFNELYRVKYLDREDIESLGFLKSDDIHHQKERLLFGEEFICFKKRVDHNDLYIEMLGNISFFNKHKLIISIWNNETMKIEKEHTPAHLFNGIIKNKSELKKLMHQLQILP